MPEDVQYVCKSCRNEEYPEWLDSVRQEIQAGYVYVCYVESSFSCMYWISAPEHSVNHSQLRNESRGGVSDCFILVYFLHCNFLVCS
jgi:hypothetical protein